MQFASRLPNHVCILDLLQDKAYQEQESIFQGSDRTLTMKDLNGMQFLDRVIKESLRLYPSVPEILREVKSDLQIGLSNMHTLLLGKNEHTFTLCALSRS
jgi:cytochrome P450